MKNLNLMGLITYVIGFLTGCGLIAHLNSEDNGFAPIVFFGVILGVSLIFSED